MKWGMVPSPESKPRVMYNEQIRNKLYGYFTQNMGMANYNKGWLKGDCPSCGKEKKFGIQLFQNRSNCFVCGFSDKPLYIIMTEEGLSTRNEVFNFLKAFDGSEYLDLKSLEKSSEFEGPTNTSIKLPEYFRLITFGRNQLAISARSYLEGRGFNITNLVLRGIGFCDRGEYSGHIIFPFYIGGKLVYFQARQYIDQGAKFKNPAFEDFGIGKSILMYNVDALALYDKIYLVESVTNSLTLGPNAIAILGKFISDYQFSLLVKSPIKEINILLDPDANDKAIKLAMRLVPHKKIKLVLSEGEKDVNDLGKKYILNTLKNINYIKYNELIRLKNQYGAKP